MRQDYATAIDDFTTVIKASPGDINAFYNRGMAFSKRGMMTEAIQVDLIAALNIRPIRSSHHLPRCALSLRRPFAGFFARARDRS